MLKIREITSVVLSLALMLSIGTTAFAAENTLTPVSEVTATELIEHLNSVEFDTDITFTEMPTTKSSNNALLQFDSVEEAEMYIRELLTERREFVKSIEAIPAGETHGLNRAKANEGWKEGKVSWWGGGNTSLFSMTNAVIRHYYSDEEISNISVSDSYMTGIYGASWTHRFGSGDAIGGTLTRFSVTGTWLIGVLIDDFPIGFSFDETMNSPVIDIDVK